MNWIKLDSGVRVNLDVLPYWSTLEVDDGVMLNAPNTGWARVTDDDIRRLDEACGLTKLDEPGTFTVVKDRHVVSPRDDWGWRCTCGTRWPDEGSALAHQRNHEG